MHHVYKYIISWFMAEMVYKCELYKYSVNGNFKKYL